MQEFFLYSQVTAHRHEQVLHILAGLTGSQPTRIAEQHLIYQQLKPSTVAASKKTPGQQYQQPQRSAYHQLVRGVSARNDDRASVGSWRLVVEDVPESGIKNVISRMVSDKELMECDVGRFQGGSEWYQFTKQYVCSGTRLVHGNVVIRITEILMSPKVPGDPLEARGPSLENLQPIDPSGTYLFEAFVRVEDGGDSALRDKAIDELIRFAKTVEGAIDLRVPDRLALDPRVKGQ